MLPQENLKNLGVNILNFIVMPLNIIDHSIIQLWDQLNFSISQDNRYV